MADGMEPSENVLQLHSDMVFEIAELLPTTCQEWNTILNYCLSRKYISEREKSQIASMEDLCKYLMRNEKIDYGEYKNLEGILRKNGNAKKIIVKYTKLIRGEQEGNGDSDSRTDDDDKPSNNAKKQKVEGDYRFRKTIDNTHDARIIDVWGSARQAVGHITGPKYGGTGFRVGTDYIMTAYHVAADITKQHKGEKENWAKLDAANVWIEFMFPKRYVGKKFHFKPELIEGCKKLDYAVLQLKPTNLEIPKPIRKFQRIDYEELFALLGFPDKPNSKIMQFDSDIVLFDLNDGGNINRRNLMIENGKEKPGYTGICNERKVLFDCWVQHGASGAPGIVMGNDCREPICTLMLLRGFPDHAFSPCASVQQEQMIEQGIKMETIADELSNRGESGQNLKKDIFGNCFT